MKYDRYEYKKEKNIEKFYNTIYYLFTKIHVSKRRALRWEKEIW